MSVGTCSGGPGGCPQFYLIKNGGLPARKKEGRWIIRRQDLPLSKGQVRAAEKKVERASRLAQEILRPENRGQDQNGDTVRQGAKGKPENRYSKPQTSEGLSGSVLEAELTLACGPVRFEPTSTLERTKATHGRTRVRSMSV